MKYLCKACREVLPAEESDAGEQAVCRKCGKPSVIPADRFAPGSVISDFEIIRLIAQGDMGNIYQAENIHTGEKIALKILSEAHTYDAKFIVSFIHSARQAMKKHFKNTVQVRAVGEDNGVFYYAMEYVKGVSLAEELRQKSPLSLQRSVEVIRTVAETLSDAWKSGGIVHRSIKPDNILTAEDGTILLADFGLARDFLDLASRSEEERHRLVQYAPPEALSDFSMTSLDIRSDIFSLGAVFYHCVTGSYPYQNFSVSEIISGEVPMDYVEPMHFNPDLPQQVQAVIQKMMVRNPKARYQDFADLLTDLKKLCPQTQVPAGEKKADIHNSGTVKIAPGKRTKVNKPEKEEHSNSYLDRMQRKRESHARIVVFGIMGTLVCLGIFIALFIKWIVYEPQRSAREIEINIARITDRAKRKDSLYKPLQKGAVERLCRGVIAHCANEDFEEAQHFINEFCKTYPVDPEFRKKLKKHVEDAHIFYRKFTNSGADVAGIEFYSRFYGKCTVISVKDSVITARRENGKEVPVLIRAFTHSEYKSYLSQVVSRFGFHSQVKSYLLCTGNFEYVLTKVQDQEERQLFEKIIYGYIRAGLSNASPLEIRQMRMLYGSLDAFQKATHPNQ